MAGCAVGDDGNGELFRYCEEVDSDRRGGEVRSPKHLTLEAKRASRWPTGNTEVARRQTRLSQNGLVLRVLVHRKRDGAAVSDSDGI